MKNQAEMEEDIGEIGRDVLKTIRRFEEKKRWRNIKIRKMTYERISKLSDLLSIEKYKVVDLSVLILSLLLSEKIILRQQTVGELELAECVIEYHYDEETKIGWAEVDPACMLKKLILPYYQRKKILENLMRNIENLSKI